MGSIISKAPQWLFTALGLQEPTLPNQLDTTAVLPVIDVGQGGWSALHWLVNQQSQPASSAAVSETLVNSSDDARLVLGVSVLHSGGAAAVEVRLRLVDPIRALPVEYSRVSIEPGFYAAWTDFRPGGGPLYVPPGVRLDIVWPATGVGETLSTSYMTAVVPAGFKAI